MITTVADLMTKLERCNPDAEVRIASLGHRTALSYLLDDADEFFVDEGSTVYLLEGAQEGYLPDSVRNGFF